MGGRGKTPLTLTPMYKNFDIRIKFDPGCITFTMLPKYKLLHELELTWSFYIVVELHYNPMADDMDSNNYPWAGTVKASAAIM